MRCIGSDDGAMPRSYCGCASGCTFPGRVIIFVASIGPVIRAGVCAAAPTASKIKVLVTPTKTPCLNFLDCITLKLRKFKFLSHQAAAEDSLGRSELANATRIRREIQKDRRNAL